ncbi:LysR family glycine cleavage system transcriptional activator [Loktanella ponticola]|uniref:LysR family glycine cleavage system transcriptional activator n=1 Tax=Yoonia ponticola TaxID=1524255 RepID=A0A7W9BM17_9RHOB|nr:transcriptional regulator GcvA [Yoonia ponticola]MBB5723058.1 LysR family glycine cleavage system transcriptional activator [Yoonia ponticola]
MSERLPPLTAFRAFDAAARHMSFARAASELNVTPAALSFQIKSLEEHLGHPLFRRLNRAVELTESGRVLAPGAAEGFEVLTKAWSAAKRLHDNRTLTVTSGPSFTSKWLAPRLFQFVQANPDIDLRFSANLRLMDFTRDEVDVAIRFSQQADEGLYSEPIFKEWLCPMVAPSLAEKIKKPSDLLNLPLLHQEDLTFLTPPADWDAWFRAAGLKPPTTAGTHFSQSDHAVNAALSGAGVVLGRISMAERHLSLGQLVMPLELSIWSNAYYRIVCAKGAEHRPQVARLMAWVREEVAAIEVLTESRVFPLPRKS